MLTFLVATIYAQIGIGFVVGGLGQVLSTVEQRQGKPCPAWEKKVLAVLLFFFWPIAAGVKMAEG